MLRAKVFALLMLLLFVRLSSPCWSAGLDIPVIVDYGNAITPVVGSYDGYNWLPPQLVVVSVPFAKGMVHPETPLTAYDAWDRPLPTEQTILSKWPDGSVRWAQLRFESHLDLPKWSLQSYAEEKDAVTGQLPWDFRIRAGSPAPAPAVAVTVKKDGQTILIDNGELTVRIDPETGAFGFSEVRVRCMKEKPVAEALSLQIDTDKKQYSTKNAKVSQCVIEESGLLRAVVLLKGKLQDDYEWQTRLFIHAGEPAIRAEHTIAGLGDQEIDDIKRIYIEYKTTLGKKFSFRAAGQTVEFDGQVGPGQSVVLQQYAPQMLDPAKDFSYELSVSGAKCSQVIGRGGCALGWLRLQDSELIVGMALQDFSEKSPKAFRVTSGGLCQIDLWPAGQTLKFSRARAITHQVLYSFRSTSALAELGDGKVTHAQAYQRTITQDLPYRAYLRPIVPVVDTEYMCSTQAFGPHISADSSKLRDFEEVVTQNFNCFYSRYFDRSTSFGMMNYGDYITPLGGDNGGNPSRPHWRDHEWEFTSGLLTYFLRTGDRRAYQLAVAAYRHYMDVDVHYTKGFNFYHSYGDSGEMHEKYYGPDGGHTVIVGLIDAYLFTGDRRALEVAGKLCDYWVSELNKKASDKLWPASQTRNVSWPLLGLVRMYEITGEQKYKETIDRAIHALVESSIKEDTMWQSALISAFLENYHRCTQDETARKLFLKNADRVLDSFYIPQLKGLGPREGGPESFYGRNLLSGPTAMALTSQFGYAYELTGDIYYLEVAYQVFHAAMKRASELLPLEQAPVNRRGYNAGATRSDGKWFSLINFYSNRLPSAFKNLTPQEYEQVKIAQPKRRPLPKRE